MAADLTSFPLPATKISELANATLPLAGTETIQLINGSINHKATVDDIGAKFTADKVILVKQESDFGPAVAGVITLQSDTGYRIDGQIIITSQLKIPNGARVTFLGASYLFDGLIYTGSGTFIDFDFAEQLSIREIKLTNSTGAGTLFSCSGDPLFRTRNELIMIGGDVQGWFSLGQCQNMNLVLLRRVFFYQNGGLTLDNIFAFTFTNCLKQNFISTSQSFLTILTNLNQAEISGNALIPAKGESVIDINASISPNSGISIGPAIPYQGLVSTGISAFADAGGGQLTVTTAAPHSFENNDYVIITTSTLYDGLYQITNVTLTSFEITAAFVSDTTAGLAFLTDNAGSFIIQPFFAAGSLDQTNNVVTAQNTGGIVPDSQTLGNNILTSTVNTSSTTTITEFTSGTWLSDESQRFTPTSTGGLIYTGRTPAAVSLSASFTCRKVGGGVSTASINFTVKKLGESVFTEIPNHRRISGAVESSDDTTLSIPFRNHVIDPQTEIKIGHASDTSITLDIFAAELNIKK